MSIPPGGLSGQTITVSRPTGTSRYGDPLPAVTHDIDNVVLAPGASTEDTDRAQQVTTRMTAYVIEPSVDVTATDRVTLPDGTRWSVTGEPQCFRSPHQPDTGVCVIELERVTG